MARCAHKRLRRSHRRGWQKALSWLPWRPYRCVDCQVRVWRYQGATLRQGLFFLSVVLAAVGSYFAGQRNGPNGSSAVGPINEPARLVATPSSGLSPLQPSTPPSASPVILPTPASTVPAKAEPPKTREPETPPIKELIVPSFSVGPLFVDRLDGDLDDDGIYRLRLRHNGQLVRTDSFTVQRPARVVVDIDGEWPVKKGNLDGERRYGIGVVKRVRVGRNNGKLRVVVDLTQSKNYEYRVVTGPGAVDVLLWKVKP